MTLGQPVNIIVFQGQPISQISSQEVTGIEKKHLEILKVSFHITSECTFHKHLGFWCQTEVYVTLIAVLESIIKCYNMF